MDGSSRDLRRQVAALLDGKIDLAQFQRWIAHTETVIEQFGSDDELDALDQVTNLLAEYTGSYITVAELLATLREEFPIQSHAAAEPVRSSA